MTNHEAPAAHVQQCLECDTRSAHFVSANYTYVRVSFIVDFKNDGTERSAVVGSGEAFV